MDEFFSSSSASAGFKAAVTSVFSGQANDRVQISGYVPPVKVRRLLTQLMASEPTLPIERVVINGTSGCSDFTGTVRIHTTDGEQVIDFVWDCRWRAEREGFVDYFGFPDQLRAAQEFDWRCFQRWERRSAN